MTWRKSLSVALILLALLAVNVGCTSPVATPTTEQSPASTAPLSPDTTVDYSEFLPPKLAKDFYPNGLTRDKLFAAQSQAISKTGMLGEDATWEGIIRITGDFRVCEGVTLNIEPGTIIFVSALSDDQKTGSVSEQDRFNPKKPPRDEAYTQNRVEIIIDGSLIARGTREQPIIITSDAAAPQTDDWLGIQFGSDSTGDLERVIIEYERIFGIGSGNVTIKQAILRNMMEAIVIVGQGEELISLSPTITQCYIYNIGQWGITVRSGSPIITHNIIRPRQDYEELNLPGFEYGALGFDHPAIPTVHHNYLEGGPPITYQEYDNSGNYHEFIEATALGFHASISPQSITYNTFCGASRAGLEIFPAPILIEHNNFISNGINLVVSESFYEPSDAWQQELFNQGVIKPLRADVIQAVNNYWGSLAKNEIAALIRDSGVVEIVFEPYETEFITDALPAWNEFPW